MKPSIKKTLWIALPLAAAALVGTGLGILMAVTQDLPQVEDLQTYEPSSVTRLLADDGRSFRSLFVERRIPVTLNDVPAHLVNAIVAVEDSRFYRHFGLDIKGILRALWRDLVSMRVVEGGSTLTQQLSKVLFLTPEKTLIRKVREAILAINIERRYSKDEILTLYLNQVYLGEGAYGVEAAARTFFGKSVSELSLPECAMIAALPRSPSLYSPIGHPERAAERMKIVLKRLLVEGYIDPAEHDEAVKEGFAVSPAPSPEDPAPYFTEAIRRELEERIGANLLYRGGVTVETTLSLELQNTAVQAVAEGLTRYEERHPPDKDGTRAQAAFLALDPGSGEVKAMVGGRDFGASPYNRSTQARRQPGSAFKPVYYAAALSAGILPTGILKDEPFEVTMRGSPPYVPENYSGKYNGPVTMRFALEQSLNAASVDLLENLGYQAAMEMAGRLGITTDLKPYPTLALGVFDVSLLEMVAAYGVFSNRGIYVRPHLIRRVLDRQGQVIYEPRPELSDALSPQAAYLVTNLLEGVVQRGTGRRARSLGRPLAGKTGTTDDYRDAWFIGYAPDLAAGAWVGFDLPRTLGHGETGASAALPIWTRFMEKALEGSPPEEFPAPDRIAVVEIDPGTGLLASPECPERMVEAFLHGTEPEVICRH